MYTFDEIEAEFSRINRLFTGIEAASKFPYGFDRDDFGGLHFELQANGVMALVGTERGKETVRDETTSLDELMYWVFRNTARSIASEYELKNRHPSNDSRRIWFELSVELLKPVSVQWASRLQREYESVLEKHPYRDNVQR